MKRRMVLGLGLTIVLAAPLFAQEAERALTEANALYRNGQFEQAAESYREAVAAGLDGPLVQYNLGNALYRSEQPGAAIAHYQAALTSAPRDADIRANLDRALAERPAGRPAPSASWLHAAAARVVASFTLSEFAVAASVCWWATLAAAASLLVTLGRTR
ncbi:MAG: tetratricopeptide repeat protein, partial [Armatimonadia bacterium]|nr:tetratricopeptide repeat protein [Armatimonadia bacterium]